jgi:hypothetical protein
MTNVAPYDVSSNIRQALYLSPLIQRTLNPRFLIYDVASNICQALAGGRRRGQRRKGR